MRKIALLSFVCLFVVGYTAAYAALQLAADGTDNPRVSELLVKYLHQNRQQDGHWKIRTRRPPLEESDFTATALSLAALRLHDQATDLVVLRPVAMYGQGLVGEGVPD